MALGTSLSQLTLDPGNSAASQSVIDEYARVMAKATKPEADDHIERHHQRGKLLARERVERLLDPGSFFLEIAALAGLDCYGADVRAGAGMIAGIGMVSGHMAMIVANDATVKGGSYFPLTVKKHLRAQEIALENGLPCFYLVDSGGAYLPLQDQVFPDKEHFGRIFYNQARLSALRIPQIAVVMGSCTAGGAYVPAMCDQTIIVREQGTIFLGGPPLVKAATGKEVTAEELGGAVVHTDISGVADYLAEDDNDALRQARVIAAGFGLKNRQPLDVTTAELPLYSVQEIPSLLPHDRRKPFPMREILARIIDRSELNEFKDRYARTVICGFARIEGVRCGIIANDGILFSESARKAAHFVELCDQRGIPLVFFQNISGFMVGKEYEHIGIARDGAKLVTAVSCTRVPKITVVMGGSFGAGNYGMAGRAYQPRFLFMWPSARISVMGPEQAASVLTQVRAESYKVRGKPWSTEEENKYRSEIESQYSAQASAYYASARLWDDGIISPLDTRSVVGLSLRVCHEQPWPETRFGVFRM